MEFSVERAYISEYQALADVIQRVWAGIERKDWFVADEPDSIRCLLEEEKGIAFKAIETNSGTLAGVLIVAIYGAGEENLGYDIHLPEEELNTVAHMESVAVLPEYRGFHLQHILMQQAEKELAINGFRYLMCTVHPENIYSKANASRQGYQVMITKEKYGGYLRDILMKKLD
jgi:ribosomal protein S18 acetylase RimI-like enzyme